LFKCALDALSVWATDWQLLPISADKSTWMKISNKNVADQITFILDSKILKPSNELKDLGVTFTSKLNFSNHITFIIKKQNSDFFF